MPGKAYCKGEIERCVAGVNAKNRPINKCPTTRSSRGYLKTGIVPRLTSNRERSKQKCQQGECQPSDSRPQNFYHYVYSTRRRSHSCFVVRTRFVHYCVLPDWSSSTARCGRYVAHAVLVSLVTVLETWVGTLVAIVPRCDAGKKPATD